MKIQQTTLKTLLELLQLLELLVLLVLLVPGGVSGWSCWCASVWLVELCTSNDYKELANVDFLTVTSRCSKCLWSGRIVCSSWCCCCCCCCCRASYFPTTTTCNMQQQQWQQHAVRVVVKVLKRFSPDLTHKRQKAKAETY